MFDFLIYSIMSEQLTSMTRVGNFKFPTVFNLTILLSEKYPKLEKIVKKSEKTGKPHFFESVKI